MRHDEVNTSGGRAAATEYRPLFAAGIAAILVVAGLPFLLMHGAGAGFNGLIETGFRVLLALPVLVVVVAVLLMIVGALLGRIAGVRIARRVVPATGVVAFCVMLAVGWYLARPRARLDAMAGAQSLSTIRDIEARAATSFGDGQAWLFSFAMNREEFTRWIGGEGFEPWPWPEEGVADEVWAWQPDGRIGTIFPGMYERPRSAERYRRDRLTVIAAPDRSLIYVYVDRWHERS